MAGLDRSETVGKVVLDLSQYRGEDLYSDGEVENRILDIVQHHSEDEFDGLIRESKEWPVLYHLSSVRGNIVNWLPFNGTEKVLEIGAGPGAITGTLAKRCAQVDCVELSKRRSEINAWRHRDCSNITIHVGNFEDIEPGLDRDYDYIFLIGVLEYAESYLHSADPFGDELRRVLGHRKPGGRIVIAIENRLGLKYWAGCAEDHSGRYFDGIESYPSGNEPAKTFSRPALESLFRRCGTGEYSFYYPYPDYKFTSVVYSDRRLPQASELNENIRNYDRDRLLLFDEGKAYRGIAGDGLYPLFANSYEIILGPAVPVLYSKFSNDRAPAFRIRTEIVRQMTENAGEPGGIMLFAGPVGKLSVRKYPETDAAREHVDRMEENGKLLAERYAPAGDPGADSHGPETASSSSAAPRLVVAFCRRTEDGGVEFPYVEGRSLESLLDESLEAGNGERFLQLLAAYRQLVEGAGPDGPQISDYDMTFANILIRGNVWTAIDYEWAVREYIPAGELLFRSLLVYYLEDGERSRRCEELIGNERLMEAIGVPEEEANRLAGEEQQFQNEVTGGVLSLGELRARMGTKVIIPAELQTEEEIQKAQEERRHEKRDPGKTDFTLTTVQVYFDTGKGYNTKESYDVAETYQKEGVIRFYIEVPAEARRLRVDPASCPCICLIREAHLGEKDVSKLFGRAVRTNGRKYTNGSIVYTTSDPNMEWDLKKIRRKAGLAPEKPFEVELTIQMAGLPSTMAEAMDRYGSGEGSR